MKPWKFIHVKTVGDTPKPKPLNPTSDRRLPTDTISENVATHQPTNARPLSYSPNHRPSAAPFSTPQGRTKCISDDNNHARFWKLLRRYWTCFSPRPKNIETLRRNQNNESVISSPGHASCYSAMNSEDRDEHLEAVISYCNNSRGLGDPND